MEQNQIHDDVNKYGQAALDIIYNSRPGNNFDFDKEVEFSNSNKVTSKLDYLPSDFFPPTGEATKYHSSSVYPQVQTWKRDNLDLTKWGKFFFQRLEFGEI